MAICLDTKDPDKIIEAVRLLAPSFGGINLEDISQPKCFYVLDELRKDCKIPVWHDDQQGTAAVNLAGLFSGLKLTGKKIDEVKVRFFGAGAASIATARILISAGVSPENVIMADSKGRFTRGARNSRTSPTREVALRADHQPEGIQGGPEVLSRTPTWSTVTRNPAPTWSRRNGSD